MAEKPRELDDEVATLGKVVTATVLLTTKEEISYRLLQLHCC